jgi:hypothetical protein
MSLVQVREPIRVTHASNAKVPHTFTWRARQHRIWKIEGVKDEKIERAQGLAYRRLFQIRTERGMRCSISYDGHRNRWRMEAVISKGGSS